MNRIKETYLLLLIVIGLISLSLYSTYALFTASTEITDVVGFNATLTTNNNVLEYEMVTVPSGEVKIIEVNINNDYESSLYYGAWYEIISPSDASDISVGLYTIKNSNPSSGQLASGSSISLLVGIKNESENDTIVNIGTVGSLTSSLNLSSSRTLLPSGWDPVIVDIVLTNFTVDGSSTTTFPTTGTYTVEPNCTNATTSYDYTTKKFIISNISTTDRINCSPTLTTTTRTPLANYIINLLGSNTSVASTSNSDGSTLEKINSELDTGATSTDYRYRGIDPNNYIWFNDELWRIIGVFDEYSHGQTGQNLVKIIRNDSIGGYVWDNDTTNSDYGDNNFPDSDIYNLLNTAYYNSINGTDADYCYSYSTYLPGKCDFTYGGIKDSYRSMIKNVTWYLGGYSSTSVTSDNMYKYERSSDTSSTYYYSGNAQTITNTPVGLMYASDYGYAAPSTCTSDIGSYDTSGCANKDWIKSNATEWSITHSTSNSYHVFDVLYPGRVYSNYTCYCYATRPVLYLDSSVYYISGDGSKTNPYIISM